MSFHHGNDGIEDKIKQRRLYFITHFVAVDEIVATSKVFFFKYRYHLGD